MTRQRLPPATLSRPGLCHICVAENGFVGKLRSDVYTARTVAKKIDAPLDIVEGKVSNSSVTGDPDAAVESADSAQSHPQDLGTLLQATEDNLPTKDTPPAVVNQPQEVNGMAVNRPKDAVASVAVDRRKKEFSSAGGQHAAGSAMPKATAPTTPALTQPMTTISLPFADDSESDGSDDDVVRALRHISAAIATPNRMSIEIADHLHPIHDDLQSDFSNPLRANK